MNTKFKINMRPQDIFFQGRGCGFRNSAVERCLCSTHSPPGGSSTSFLELTQAAAQLNLVPTELGSGPLEIRKVPLMGLYWPLSPAVKPWLWAAGSCYGNCVRFHHLVFTFIITNEDACVPALGGKALFLDHWFSTWGSGPHSHGGPISNILHVRYLNYDLLRNYIYVPYVAKLHLWSSNGSNLWSGVTVTCIKGSRH